MYSKGLYYDYYFHRQETLWSQNAMKSLPALLNSSDMLACGEDLGMIPACVHPVMQELGLIGLRIQRMPSEPDMEFGIPSQYPYMTDLLALKAEYAKRPAIEETINDPTNPKHYWRFRLHVTLETLLADKEIKMTIRNLVKSSGRSHPPLEEGISPGCNTAGAVTDKQQVAKGKGPASLPSQVDKVSQKEIHAVS